MAFRNPQTGYYYTERKLSVYGKLPRRTLGTKKKGDAKKLENAIIEVDRLSAFENPDYSRIIEAFIQGKLTATRILQAKHAGRLGEMARALHDQPFRDVYAAYRTATEMLRGEAHAGSVLVNYAGNEPWSALCDTEYIHELLTTIESEHDIKPQSVKRKYGRLLSKIIRWKEGALERDRIFGNLSYAGHDDTRQLRMHIVTKDAIARLIEELRKGYQKEGDECAPIYTAIAISQGVSPGVLSRCINVNFSTLRITFSGDDYQEDAEGQEIGRLFLTGTKTITTKQGKQTRDRYVWIAPSLLPAVQRYWKPAKPHAPLFPLKDSRYYTLFKKARTRAGLDHAATDDTPLRPHDLRSVFAMFAEKERVNRTLISRGLGHTTLQMTDRYLSNAGMVPPQAVIGILAGINQN